MTEAKLTIYAKNGKAIGIADDGGCPCVLPTEDLAAMVSFFPNACIVWLDPDDPRDRAHFDGLIEARMDSLRAWAAGVEAQLKARRRSELLWRLSPYLACSAITALLLVIGRG